MLSNTLYRVPRQNGLSLIQGRGPGQARELTSRRLLLDAGQSESYRSAAEETVIVLQEGAGDLVVGSQRWSVSRKGVFAERATALYLPPGAELLATSSACPVQMFRMKSNVYATQFHPELDVPGIVTRVRVYQHAGYFPPEEMEELILRLTPAVVTEPGRMLANFVARYG